MRDRNMLPARRIQRLLQRERNIFRLCMRCLRSDEGSVTIEAAIGSSAMIVLTGLLLGGIAVGAAHITAIDQAAAAARSYALGIEYEPERGEVSVTVDGELVVATARVGTFFGFDMSAQAKFPAEYVDGNSTDARAVENAQE